MIFYFYGDNTYEIVQAVKSIQNQYKQRTSTGLDVAHFDMSENALSDLLDSLAVQPMFASSRLIVVRGLGSNKTAQQKYTEIISLIPESTAVVFIDSEIDKRSRYHKYMSKGKNAREFAALDPSQMRNWIRKKIKELGGEIDTLSIQKFYEVVAHEWRSRDRSSLILSGQDQWRFIEEIKKLVSYNPKITTQNIELLVVANPESSIFELVEAAAGGQSTKAINIYANLTSQGVSEQQMLAMLHWQYRIITLVKENIDKDASWTREFSINPYSATKAAHLGNNLAMSHMRQAYELMVETDTAIKSGDQPASIAMEELIYKLTRLA